jgi:glycosyltransferase involved in cell wall biosynthesis
MLALLNILFAKRFTWQKATVIHIHSKVFLPAMQAAGIPANRVFIIPHGSFAHHFLPYRKDGVARERAVLFFGRLEPYKGLDDLVHAGLKLKEAGQKVHVIIAGPGRLPKRLKAVVSANPDLFEVHERYLSNAEVALLFQRVAVCVLPYRVAAQSSVPTIAAAFDVPTVATAVGAFVEDVPFYGGLLVPPDNPDALADAILRAFSLKPKNAFARSWQALAPRFLEMYRRAVELKV